MGMGDRRGEGSPGGGRAEGGPAGRGPRRCPGGGGSAGGGRGALSGGRAVGRARRPAPPGAAPCRPALPPPPRHPPPARPGDLPPPATPAPTPHLPCPTFVRAPAPASPQRVAHCGALRPDASPQHTRPSWIPRARSLPVRPAATVASRCVTLLRLMFFRTSPHTVIPASLPAIRSVVYPLRCLVSTSGGYRRLSGARSSGYHQRRALVTSRRLWASA